MKKFSAWITSIFPIILVLFAVVLAAFITFTSIDLIRHVPTGDVERNIAEGQLIVEMFGLVALVLALRQFLDLSKKPKLRLWLETLDIWGAWQLSPEPILTILSTKVALQHEGGTLQAPIVDRVRYTLRFKILVENYGQKVARFVKFTLRLDGEELAGCAPPILPRSDEAPGKWFGPPPPFKDQEPSGPFQGFLGGEDLVLYSHPLQVTNMRDWLMQLGEFELRFDAEPSAYKVDLRIVCTLQSDEFDLATCNIDLPVLENPYRG